MKLVLKMISSNHGCHDRQYVWVERMSFMDGFSGYNQIKMYPNDEKHTFFRTPLGVYCYTVMPFYSRIRGDISKRYEYNLLRAYTQNSGMLCKRYCSEKSCQRWSHSRYKDSIQYHAGASIEEESRQIFPGGSQWEVP